MLLLVHILHGFHLLLGLLTSGFSLFLLAVYNSVLHFGPLTASLLAKLSHTFLIVKNLFVLVHQVARLLLCSYFVLLLLFENLSSSFSSLLDLLPRSHLLLFE